MAAAAAASLHSVELLSVLQPCYDLPQQTGLMQQRLELQHRCMCSQGVALRGVLSGGYSQGGALRGVLSGGCSQGGVLGFKL